LAGSGCLILNEPPVLLIPYTDVVLFAPVQAFKFKITVKQVPITLLPPAAAITAKQGEQASLPPPFIVILFPPSAAVNLAPEAMQVTNALKTALGPQYAVTSPKNEATQEVVDEPITEFTLLYTAVDRPDLVLIQLPLIPLVFTVVSEV